MKIRFVLFCVIAAAALPLAYGETADFGLVAITNSDTARLTADCNREVNPGPCVVMFEFRDISGRVLQEQDMTLAPGTSGFADWTPTAAGQAAPSPFEIIPCIKVGIGAVFSSLEVIDNTSSRTRLLVDWGDRSMAKTGLVDFALGGITRSDTGRLTAFCSDAAGDVPPGPCDIVFQFRDTQGALLKESRVTLAPGTGGFLDIVWQETHPVSRRVEIDPCWTIVGGSAFGTFQIIDNTTARNTVVSYPATLLMASPQ